MLCPYLKLFVLAVWINLMSVDCKPNLTILNVTENKVHIEWTPITDSKDPILKYQVSAFPVKSFSPLEMLNRNEWTYQNTTHRSDLVGLHPGTQYNVSVWGVTAQGYTNASSLMAWTQVGEPEEPDPVELIERNEGTLRIRLPQARSENGPISSYLIVVVENSPVTVFEPSQALDHAMASEAGLPFYIAARLPAPQEETKEFTVGDGKKYDKFLNVPLDVNKEYQVVMGVESTFHGITKVAYSPLLSTLESKIEPHYGGSASRALSVVLSASIGVCGFLLVLSVIAYFLLRQHYARRRNSSLDHMVLKVQGEDNMMTGEEEEEELLLSHVSVPRNHLEVKPSVLGDGRIGQVRDALLYQNTDANPIHCSATLCCGEKERRSLMRELSSLRRLTPHPHVASFLGVAADTGGLWVCVAHDPSSLRGALLRSRQPNPSIRPSSLNPQILLQWAAGVTDGLAHLHAARVLHNGPLTARCVLLGDDLTPRLAHYSVSQFSPLGKKCPATRWCAPEVLNLNNSSSRSDVWSLGVLLWELFTLGGSPYAGVAARDVLPRVLHGMRLPRPQGLQDAMFQRVLQCWELDPDERPTCVELAAALHAATLAPKDHLSLEPTPDYQYAKFDPVAEED